MRQHVVPEAYLREFTDFNGYFFSLNTRWKNICRVNTGQVCYIEDYYDIVDPEQQLRNGIRDPRFIELNAFKYEPELGLMLSFFKNRPSIITTEQVTEILGVYLSLKQRNPYYTKILQNEEVLNRVHKETIEIVLNDAKNHPTFKNIDREILFQVAEMVLAKNASDPEYLHKIHMNGLVETANGVNEQVKQTFQRLLQMNFYIYEATGDDYFITTDNPGYTIGYTELGKAIVVNTDFAFCRHVFFPINPRQALFLDNPNPLNWETNFRHVNYKELNSDQIYQFNRASLAHTIKFVFGFNKLHLETFRNCL